MYILQSTLFHGMTKDFVKEIMDIADKVDFKENDFLFQEGDQADHFFILLKGSVNLISGDIGQMIHAVSRAGEAFGWSSLVGRKAYSTSARCGKPTKVLKINAERLQEILALDLPSGFDFYRRLAGVLGERLIRSYTTFPRYAQTEASSSIGARHLMESEGA